MTEIQNGRSASDYNNFHHVREFNNSMLGNFL